MLIFTWTNKGFSVFVVTSVENEQLRPWRVSRDRVKETERVSHNQDTLSRLHRQGRSVQEYPALVSEGQAERLQQCTLTILRQRQQAAPEEKRILHQNTSTVLASQSRSHPA